MTRYTKHGQIRCNQRGIRLRDVDLIMRYGKTMGSNEYLITDTAKRSAITHCKKKIVMLERQRPEKWAVKVRKYKKVIQRFDKLGGKFVVTNSESGHFKIITGYQVNSRQIKKRLRWSRRKGYFV